MSNPADLDSLDEAGSAEELLMVGPYRLLKVIGRGTYADVVLGLHEPTNVPVALKVISKHNLGFSRNGLLRLEREIQALQALDHPHIVRFIEWIELQGYFVIVTEFVQGEDLFEVLAAQASAGVLPRGKGLSPRRAFRYFYQLVSALQHCHSQGFAHRDIKLENILLDTTTDSVKLADFGMANVIRAHELMSTFCGTPQYVAPELVEGKKYDGPAADVWSLGIVLYAMLTGRHPFVTGSNALTQERIVQGKFHLPATLDVELSYILRRMICTSPRDRITLKQIMEHRWWVANCAALGLDPRGAGKLALPPALLAFHRGMADPCPAPCATASRRSFPISRTTHDLTTTDQKHSDADDRTDCSSAASYALSTANSTFPGSNSGSSSTSTSLPESGKPATMTGVGLADFPGKYHIWADLVGTGPSPPPKIGTKPSFAGLGTRLSLTFKTFRDTFRKKKIRPQQ